MGRDAGHIALNAGIGAGAEEILIPEEDMGLERLLDSLRRSKASGKSSSIVVIAEGDKIGKNVFELKDYIEENFPEYDIRVSVLGHMQRGGSPSCFDRVLASRLGVKAVESLLEGKSNFMVGMLSDKVALTPLEQAIKGHSEIDREKGLLTSHDQYTILKDGCEPEIHTNSFSLKIYTAEELQEILSRNGFEIYYLHGYRPRRRVDRAQYRRA